MRKEVSVLMDKIKKGLKLIPSFLHRYKHKKCREMEIKELFRACCYMIVSEKTCSKSQIQRRFGVNYKDASFVFDMLLKNDLIRPEYKPTINELSSMEKLLDILFK